MFRRKFLQLATLAGAGGLSPLESLAGVAVKTTTFRVKGFTCVTCATGLDTMLSRQAGIKSSQSTYPAGICKVIFNPDRITEESIVSFITDLGFTVTSEARA
jgi:copper chaperone CopZ